MLAPLLVAGLLVGQTSGESQRSTPLARAVDWLSRQSELWPREHRCYSCHDSGDAARAILASGPRAPQVQDRVKSTFDFLLHPSRWDENGPKGPFSDKRLARLSFSFALATAVETRAVEGKSALVEAATALVSLQDPDGSWSLEGVEDVGSPATPGRPLATLLARDTLTAADPGRFQQAITRANDYLANHPVVTIVDAAVTLMAESGAAPRSTDRTRAALTLIREGRSEDGGWGPRRQSPPETFDTALVLLGLSRLPGDEAIRPLVAGARSYLIARQGSDGSWDETTRPTGGVSHAQRVSTTAWAVLALKATAH